MASTFKESRSIRPDQTATDRADASRFSTYRPIVDSRTSNIAALAMSEVVMCDDVVCVVVVVVVVVDVDLLLLYLLLFAYGIVYLPIFLRIIT